MAVNDLIADRSIAHQIALLRFSRGISRRLLPLMEKAEQSIIGRIANTQGTWTRQRLEQQLQQTRIIIDGLRGQMQDQVRDELADLVESEIEFYQSLITNQIPVSVNFVTPGVAQTVSAAMLDAAAGRTYDEWFDSLGDQWFRKIRDELRIGFVNGETIPQVTRRIQDALAINRRAAEAVARTLTNHLATKARELTMQANSDLVKGMQWLSSLDSRTTPICIARDNEIYPIDEGPRPPAHVNCRSVMIPVLKSWREMGIDMDEVPDTRAAREGLEQLNGKVPDNMNYGQWLARQPVEIQDEVLGVARAKAFRSGDYSVDRFIDERNNRFFTIDELKQKNVEIERAR